MFKPIDPEQFMREQIFTRAAAAGVGAGAGVAASVVASNPAHPLESALSPTVFRFPSDLTDEDKLAAMAGALAEVDEEVLQRHVLKNSPARRAHEEEKKAKEEARSKRRIVSCVFVFVSLHLLNPPIQEAAKRADQLEALQADRKKQKAILEAKDAEAAELAHQLELLRRESSGESQ